MYVQTKKELLDYIEQCTMDFQTEALHRYSANYISREKNISRNLVSQYLNELVKEGILIKINSRPVYFMHRKSLERLYDVKVTKSLFYSIDELMEMLLRSDYCQKDFGKAIGNQLSLSYSVEQCKAAVRYPPFGLPILIVGSTGTGKSYFARLTYEYAVNNKLIDAASNFYVINCSEFKNDSDKLGRLVFGENQDGEERKGMLEMADGSILFFDEVHNLDPDFQERLFIYMDNGRFQRIGEKDRWRASSARLIFATTKKPEEALLKTLLRRIPFVTQMLDLEERSLNEKEELIIFFLKKEAKRIGREVYFSRQVLNILLNYVYKENVGELENVIRMSCAAAYLNSTDDVKLQIMSYHLPATLLSDIKASVEVEDGKEPLIYLADFQRDVSMDRMTSLFDDLLNTFLKYAENEISFEKFLEAGMEHIYAYYDYIVFERCYSDVKVKAIIKVLSSVFEEITDKYAVVIPANCGFVLSRSIYTITQFYASLELWEKRRLEDLNHCLEWLHSKLPQETAVAAEVSSAIKGNLDLQLNQISEIFLILNIKAYNRKLELNDTLGIIISHGYSTAGSIADTCNQLLHFNIFNAIDMPLDTKVSEIALKLKKYILGHAGYRNILLLVDMGSLEEIGKELEDIPNIKIGIINHISTQLVLEVGSRILQRQPMDKYLEEVCKEVYSSCKIISTERKIPTILFTSELGNEAAERIMKLFQHGFSEKRHINLVLYDYYELLKNQEIAQVFSKYHIVCVVGTLDPGFKDVPFISLDDLVTNKGTAYLEKIFVPYLTKKEIDFLEEKIVENFSLQNVVESLTILNADTLLSFVVNAVKRLQALLECDLNNKTIIGLYVHICCLVERLVTKAVIEARPGEKEFIRKEKQFVSYVNSAFREIQQHYKIQLPDGEIVFLYEYISHNEE